MKKFPNCVDCGSEKVVKIQSKKTILIRLLPFLKVSYFFCTDCKTKFQ